MKGRVDPEGCQEPQVDGARVNDLFDGIALIDGCSVPQVFKRPPGGEVKLPLLSHETEKGCFGGMKFTFLHLAEQPVLQQLQHLLDFFNTLPGGVGEHQNAIYESERHD